MALLAILAHELGHLLLAETNADGALNTHPRSQQCGASAPTCFDSQFLAPAGVSNALWNTTTFHQHMRRWIDFGGQNRRNHNQYQNAAHDLDAAIHTGNYAALLDGEFVSFYAAVSPEEDFVETYKYQILANVAQSSNLTLHFPGGTSVPVLNKVLPNPAGNHLQVKVSCVNSLTP
jgi:hypothetical protein